MRLYPNSKRTGLMAAIAGLAIVATGVTLPGNAWAQARNTTVSCGVSGTTASNTEAVVSFVTKGVGNANLCYVAEIPVSGECSCLNGGAQCPNAQNKTSLTGTQTASGIFTGSKNGQIRGSLDVPGFTNVSCATDPDLHCGGGQTPVLDGESFDSVTLKACVTSQTSGTCSCPSSGPFVVNETADCTGSPADFFPQCP
jgi:hypothetical protein